MDRKPGKGITSEMSIKKSNNKKIHRHRLLKPPRYPKVPMAQKSRRDKSDCK